MVRRGFEASVVKLDHKDREADRCQQFWYIFGKAPDPAGQGHRVRVVAAKIVHGMQVLGILAREEGTLPTVTDSLRKALLQGKKVGSSPTRRIIGDEILDKRQTMPGLITCIVIGGRLSKS